MHTGGGVAYQAYQARCMVGGVVAGGDWVHRECVGQVRGQRGAAGSSGSERAGWQDAALQAGLQGWQGGRGAAVAYGAPGVALAATASLANTDVRHKRELRRDGGTSRGGSGADRHWLIERGSEGNSRGPRAFRAPASIHGTGGNGQYGVRRARVLRLRKDLKSAPGAAPCVCISVQTPSRGCPVMSC